MLTTACAALRLTHLLALSLLITHCSLHIIHYSLVMPCFEATDERICLCATH